MTASMLAALFATLFALAIVPSTSVLTVVARAADGGMQHGALAALGVVTGDVVYICVALFGVNALFALSDVWLDVLRLMAAGLLGWLAWSLWHAGTVAEVQPGGPRSARASFAAGLGVTLVDYKVIGFYLVLLPAFIDMTALSTNGAAGVLLVAVAAVFSAKFAWVLALRPAMSWLQGGRTRLINHAAAVVLAVVALGMLLSVVARG